MSVRRPRVLVYGLLAASLALNLAGAGYLGFVGFRPKPPRNVENTIAFVSGRFPPPIAVAVRTKLEARRDDLREALRAVKKARRETRDAMSDADFDPARATAAFSDVRAKMDAFQTIVHASIVDALPGISEADRAKIDRDKDD